MEAEIVRTLLEEIPAKFETDREDPLEEFEARW